MVAFVLGCFEHFGGLDLEMIPMRRRNHRKGTAAAEVGHENMQLQTQK